MATTREREECQGVFDMRYIKRFGVKAVMGFAVALFGFFSAVIGWQLTAARAQTRMEMSISNLMDGEDTTRAIDARQDKELDTIQYRLKNLEKIDVVISKIDTLIDRKMRR